MSETEAAVEASSSGQGEPLSCVACRNRKLKCDKVKPACTRCARIKGECVYPESRRKPAFKRRNARELEARLAQVEVLLKEAGERRSSEDKVAEKPTEAANFESVHVPINDNVFFQGMDYTASDIPFDQFGNNAAFSFDQENPTASAVRDFDGQQQPDNNPFNGELMDLGGIFESLPPFEVMEDLNRTYFERQHHFAPLIQPGRYMQAFYAAPHMKPPMCLQYGIWAIAAHEHPKYGSYHDVFYQRARRYAESDEMKVTTHLPADEAAFHSGEEKKSCGLHDAFNGQPYSSFTGTILVCHLFNRVMKHIHHPQPNDNPEDYEYGEFWRRHRDIDNTISSAFMFLPEAFRLPENYRDPTASHTNLNLHASVICLHHAAIERIDDFKLPETIKKACQNRLSTAAQEIVNIVKLTSHVSSNPKTPLAALALYCAASVYIYLYMETQAPNAIGNLEFIISAMAAIGRDHVITRAFLRQVIFDIERNDIQQAVRLPQLDSVLDDITSKMSHNIPLLARSRISRHCGVQPPLPGRLPLGKPVGKIIVEGATCGPGGWAAGGVRDFDSSVHENSSSGGPAHKRKRTTPSTLDGSPESSEPSWTANGISDRLTATSSSHSSPQHDFRLQPFLPRSSILGEMALPHRTGSPAANSNVNANTRMSNASKARPPQNNNHDNISAGHGSLMNMGSTTFGMCSEGLASDTQTAKDGMNDWDMASMSTYSQFVGNEPNINASNEDVPWGFGGTADANVDWDAIGASIGVETAGASGANPGDGGRKKMGSGGTGAG